MKQNFRDCLTRLLKSEGGYTNDPNDSGGPTNYGITITDYRHYINQNGTAEDVRNMSVTSAESIYKSKYWDALNCDSLSSGVDYTVFDYGVNSGLERPRKALERFKDKTGSNLINAINDERVSFLEALERSQPKDRVFNRGWMSRVASVRAHSLDMARDNVTGPVAGASVVGIGGYLSQVFQHHMVSIIIATIFATIIIGGSVHYFKNKGN